MAGVADRLLAVGGKASVASAIAGRSVRVDLGAHGGGRGWRILRAHWKDFVAKRDDIPSSVLLDLEGPPPVKRPVAQNMSKDGFDRMVDKITSDMAGSTSPRSVRNLAVWQNAAQSNLELRALLKDPWLHIRDDGETRIVTPKASMDPCMSFFPHEWSNCLSEDTMAELILDAYTSAFCDAFLDGAISLVEVSTKWHASQSGRLGKSMSDSTLQPPQANRRLRNSSHTDKALLNIGLAEGDPVTSEGFTMHGLSKDNWEAWNARSFHKSKNLDPFVKRIQNATEAQRPQRRIVKLAEQRQEPWNQRSSSKPRLSRAGTVVDFDRGEEPRGDWLMAVGTDGKTRFPYSLVSHRAFLESQKDPILKEKARRLAPLKFSTPVSL